MSWWIVNLILGAVMVVLAFQQYNEHHMIRAEIDIFFAIFNFGLFFFNVMQSTRQECGSIDI